MYVQMECRMRVRFNDGQGWNFRVTALLLEFVWSLILVVNDAIKIMMSLCIE